MRNKNEQKTANALKEFFKHWPWFYYFIYDYLGPLYFGGLSVKGFLKKYPSSGKCFNLGSGARRIAQEIINVDAMEYPEVDIVADVIALPLEDGEAGTIICEEVLEHISEPEQAIREILRITKPGGYVFITVPFMYPYHASPNDYQRWTHMGLRELFSDFEIVEMGVRSGPFSTLTVYLCYFFATMLSFGNEKLYWTLALGFTFIFFPIKLLDVIGNRLPNAINMSAVLYCVVKKK